MKEIPLTRGLVALVDDEDYDTVAPYKWHADHEGYACRKGPNPIKPGKITTIFMHRVLLGLAFGDLRKGDHKNGNRADNRRENLRIATDAQNCQNRKLGTNNTSGFKGVYLHKASGKWHAKIRANGKDRSLGYYHNAEEAHNAYQRASELLHREFANFGEKRAA